MAYLLENPQTDEELIDYPWFVSSCSTQNHAKRILESCPTIENGNFLVRRSKNKNAKYTITIWFQNTTTNIRVIQLDNGRCHLDFTPSGPNDMPTFSTIKELIDFFTKHKVKVNGHSAYRQSIKNHGQLLPCDPTTLPFTSPSQRCILCSRTEAETILKTTVAVEPGHFIVRPSAYANYPYSLSILVSTGSIYHFQIGFVTNGYRLGSHEQSNTSKEKTFSSMSALLEHHFTSPIIFEDDENKDHSILLKLYSVTEYTRL